MCSDFLFQHKITPLEGLLARHFVSLCRRSFTLQLIGPLCIIHPVSIKPMPKQLFTGCICLCDGGMCLSLDVFFSSLMLRLGSFDVHALEG